MRDIPHPGDPPGLRGIPYGRHPHSDGAPATEQDAEVTALWHQKWAPRCPDGNPQRLRRALGFRERSVAELELRVPLGGDDHGVCQLVVDERDEEVYVRVLVCYSDRDNEPSRPDREYIDCPVRVWLGRPLGNRAVIDVDSDSELPLYVPRYLNNVLQPDYGYHAVNRRRCR